MADEFFSGLSSDLGLVSLGTFFASKESTSATPKAFNARRQGENHLEENKPACATKAAAGKRARREGEISFMEQPAVQAKQVL